MTAADLSYKELGDAGVAEECGKLESMARGLTSVDLGGNEITDKGAAAITSLVSRCPKLQELDLRHNRIQEGICEITTALLQSRKLTRLDLSSNYIRDYGAEVCAHLVRYSHSLTELNLTDTGIGEEGARLIGQALQNGAVLKSLQLGYNRLRNEGIQHLSSSLRNNKRLKTLDISDNAIGDEGAEALAAVLPKCVLEDVDISVNPELKASGAKALADGLALSSTLVRLDLGCTGIGDEGMVHLAAALTKNTSLRTLGIVSCELTDACAEAIINALKHNRTITDIDMINNEEFSMKHKEVIYSAFWDNRDRPVSNRRVDLKKIVPIFVALVVIVVSIHFAAYHYFVLSQPLKSL